MNDVGTRVVDNEIIKGLRGRLCPSEINEWVYYDEDSEQYKRFPPIGGSKSQQDLIDAYYK